MIAVGPTDARKRLAGISRHVEVEAERIDGVLVGRVDSDLPEHPAVGSRMAAHVLVALADFPPGGALVVGPVDLGRLDARFDNRPAVRVPLALAGRPARIVVVDERIEHARIRQRHVQADPAAELRRRQALARVGPGFSAVGALPDATLGRSRLHAWIAPLAPGALPRGGIERVGITGIHHEVDGSRSWTLVKD